MSLNPERIAALERQRARTRSAGSARLSARSPARTTAASPRRTSSYGNRPRQGTGSRERAPSRGRYSDGRTSTPPRRSRREDFAARSLTQRRGMPEAPPNGTMTNTMARVMARRRSPSADGFDGRSGLVPSASSSTASVGAGAVGGLMGLAALRARLQAQPTDLGAESPGLSNRERGWTSSGEDEWDDLEPEPEPRAFFGSKGDRLRHEIRSDMQAMKFGAVYRKAVELGIDPADANSQDHESEHEIKDSLIELMMGRLEFQVTDPRFEDARLADMEDELREELEPMSIGQLSRRAQTSEDVSEGQFIDAQDSDNPHAALVDLLVDVEVKARLAAEQSDAAVRVQARYRGHAARKSFQRARAQTLLAKDTSEEQARAERRKARLAEELAALQRGDSIISMSSDADRSRSLLLPANRTGLMLQHTGGDLAAARQGSLSAEGVRRTERVAAELFALRKAADELQPERSIYNGQSYGHAQEGHRGRVSAVQAELARRERATRRTALEQELAQLQHSFHQRLAGDRSAGELMVARSSIQSPSFGGEDFSARSAVADVDGAPSGTPRQRVYAAERRYERRLETQAREQESATRIQAVVRGRRARAQARTKLARKRDAYSVHLFDGRFVEERVLRDAGLLKSTRKA